ncbi:MAG: low molecular weight phosphotyrosine protein phosphatase [Parachlamydiales bacterium]|nr:low molecular weight phosphotyrosine protein phosphatase [Parachlamydiales bacterium]
MTAIMFVCMANICRSPALMAVLNHLAAAKKMEVHADSSGIGWVHLGERPSQRTFEAAKKRGILIDHRTQQFQDEFFEIYDLILTVDEEIAEQLKLRGPKYAHKIRLASDFSRKYKGMPIPDPYYLSDNGFDEVLEMIIDCCEGLLDHLSKQKVKGGNERLDGKSSPS